MPHLVAFEEHLERLFSSAKKLSIIGDTDALKSRVREEALSAIRQYYREPINEQLPSARVKVSLTEEGHQIEVTPYTPAWSDNEAISLLAVAQERPLPEHKTLDVSVSVCSRSIAERYSFEEALLLGGNGEVREGAWSNIFWFDSSGELFTPKSAILPGITRGIIFQLLHCSEKDANLEELLSAREIFITRSTTGITPVAELWDGRRACELSRLWKSSGHALSENVKERYANYIQECASLLPLDQTERECAVGA